jgi:hypothetical protein
MRADMAKVLTERPRTFYWRTRCYGRNDEVWRLRRTRLPLDEGEDEEGRWKDLAAQISGGGKRGMRQCTSGRRYARKEPAENLRPLWRFLRQQVGRRWDAVFAEVRRRVPPRGAVNLHVYQHLNDLVTRDVVLGLNGAPWALVGHPGPTEWRDLRVRRGSWDGVWVHPDTGLLHRVGAPLPGPPRGGSTGGAGDRPRHPAHLGGPPCDVSS